MVSRVRRGGEKGRRSWRRGHVLLCFVVFLLVDSLLCLSPGIYSRNRTRIRNRIRWWSPRQCRESYCDRAERTVAGREMILSGRRGNANVGMGWGERKEE